MKITLIHGQNHKGSTYHVARMLADKTGGDITEFFLPKDLGVGCLGCYACTEKGRDACPHAEQAGAIFGSMLASDVIIIGSPTYVMEMSGHLKNFFDHIFSAWLSHRPEGAMFTKTAVAVSTAAGVGMGGVTKSIARQFFYLGVPKVYRLPVRSEATSWKDVKKKGQIEARAGRLAEKIAARKGRAAPGIKLRLMFLMMRGMQKTNDWAPLDKKHWEDKKWLGKARPWK
jgi:multimeric flavodoxin WrbA